MVRSTKAELLRDFKRNKRNRTLGETQELLAMYGFSSRAATKEQGGVWTRGRHRVTLPKPHGPRDKVLGQRYIGIVIAVIEAAEAEDALKEQREEMDE